jgi:hypothetical protein
VCVTDFKNKKRSQVLVAQSCNLTYPGTDQKDCSSKPAQANSSTDPISKIDKKKKKTKKPKMQVWWSSLIFQMSWYGKLQ